MANETNEKFARTPVGNAAAVRSLLEVIRDRFYKDGLGRHHIHLNEYWYEKIQAALSAPARNCDRFATAKVALEAFENETGERIAIEFIKWLFTAAEKGANDEQKSATHP